MSRLRRVRDLIDREYASPLDAEALGRREHTYRRGSANATTGIPGCLSRQFDQTDLESRSADHLDEVLEQVRARGADFVQRPTDQFYGVRDCAIRDPAGSLIRIQQRRQPEKRIVDEDDDVQADGWAV